MNKQTIDSILHARWVIPVEPRGRCLDNHSIAVADGQIAAVAPRAEIERCFNAQQEYELSDHALIPGLVNSHCHAAMALLRGIADDLPLMDWLQQHIWPAEQRWVNEEFVADGTELAVAEMLRGGTTCFNDMYFFPDVSARVAARAGIRATLGLIVLEFPSAWAAGPDEYLDKGLALHDELAGDPLIRTAFAPHAPYTVSDASFQRLQVLVDELDLPLHIHVHETEHEVQQSFAEHGTRPLRRLHGLGLLSPNLLAVHMTQLSAEEIQLVADHNVHVLHCPESNLKLASGFCPVQALLSAGVNVALGTDGAASNNDLDMFGEMRTAALLAKAVAQDAAAVGAAQALEMATLNGARALGREAEIGSLVPGKAADLVAVDLSGINTQPLFDPISQLVYAAGRADVTDVWVQGRQLVRQRRLTQMDEAAVLAKAQLWAQRISNAAGDGDS